MTLFLIFTSNWGKTGSNPAKTFFWLPSSYFITFVLFCTYQAVGRAETRSSLEREVQGSNLGQVKSKAVLPKARHRCDISSKEAVLPGCNDAEMGPANSLHASA